MNRKKITAQVLRRLIFLLLIILMWLLQFVLLPMLPIPFPVMLLLPATVSAAMNEHEFSGMLFGLAAGALWDIFSPVTDGFLALFFAFSAYIFGLLTHYFMRNTLLTALVLNTVFTVSYSAVCTFFFAMNELSAAAAAVYIKTSLPAIVCSVALTIPLNVIIRKISVRFRGEKTPRLSGGRLNEN